MPDNLTSHFPLLAGELNLLVGHPGAGKSLLSLDLASRLARNAPLPPLPDTPAENPTPADIIYLSAEYHHDTSHLLAAGIPPRSIFQPEPPFCSLTPPKIRTVFADEKPRAPLFEFLESLTDTLKNPRLLILDPIHAFIDSINSNACTLRAALLPLIQFGHDHHCAILAVSHITKHRHASTNPTLTQILGNVAITAYARSIFLLTADQNHPNRRLLAHLKNNQGPRTPTLAFTFRSRPAPENQPPSNFLPPILEWEPQPLIPSNNSQTDDPADDTLLLKKSQLELACEFLTDALKDGPQPSRQIYKDARALALSAKTLHRARLRMGVPCFNKDRKWLMSLPQRPSQEAI